MTHQQSMHKIELKFTCNQKVLFITGDQIRIGTIQKIKVEVESDSAGQVFASKQYLISGVWKNEMEVYESIEDLKKTYEKKLNLESEVQP